MSTRAHCRASAVASPFQWLSSYYPILCFTNCCFSIVSLLLSADTNEFAFLSRCLYDIQYEEVNVDLQFPHEGKYIQGGPKK